MYQTCCKKCGSISLHTEKKENNTGLYCDDCGAWIKWLSKDELRAFEYSQNANREHAIEDGISNNTMKIFLLEIPDDNWGQDYAAVVVARDELRVEKLARMASGDFRAYKEIKITEIDLNEEGCVFIAKTGS